MALRKLFTASAMARLAWTGLIILAAPPARAQDGKSVDKKPVPGAEQAKESTERLANMRRRAEGTRVVAITGDRRDEIPMRSEPVFRYADQPRGIVDATLWVWGEPGRPVVLQKVEYFPPTPTNWTYCLASLSSGLVGAEWRGGRQWTATKPGIALHPLDEAPGPSTTKVGRLRQMKEIARRFAVRASEGTHRDEQLRLMPQPVHRYEDTEHGLADGAIFGFGSGTNPNCLLLIELRTDSASAPSWQYGFVGMSAESLRAKLDDRETWFFPAAGKIGAIDSWIWFFESPGMED
jgi:hypothetical protein